MTAPGTAREEYQAMEFSVTKSALLNELSMTQGVVERKTTIPILSNLLVEASHSQLTITATDLELSIRTLCDAKVKREGAGTIPAKKLLELVRLLILRPDTLAMVATDGHRLALAETDHKLSGMNGELKVLVPKKAMDEVEKLSGAAESDAQFDFAKDESHLFFQVHHRLLISRILTGQFPNYEAVLPRDNNKHVVIERGELTDAVRRVSQLADQRSHAVKLSISGEGVEISASSPEYGEAKESIEKEYKGDPISIGFNSSYMLDFLGAAADGPVSIELKDEQSAGQMRPLADESYRYRYIIMPMRI